MAKIKIQGNASGTGVITLEAPNTNTDRAITLPDSAGELINIAPSTSGNVLTSDGTDWTSAAAAAGGKVLNVWSDTYNSTLYDSSLTSTLEFITGFEITLTPDSTSSRFVVMANTTANTVSSHVGVSLQIARGSTGIGGTMQVKNDNYGYTTNHTLMTIDSPSTTSSITYKLGYKDVLGDDGDIYINRHYASAATYTSEIIVWELSS
jgi:hypothetical protein